LIKGGDAEVVNLGNPGESVAASSNDRSLLLRFEHETLSCLFTGDISHTIESQLIAQELTASWLVDIQLRTLSEGGRPGVHRGFGRTFSTQPFSNSRGAATLPGSWDHDADYR